VQFKRETLVRCTQGSPDVVFNAFGVFHQPFQFPTFAREQQLRIVGVDGFPNLGTMAFGPLTLRIALNRVG